MLLILCPTPAKNLSSIEHLLTLDVFCNINRGKQKHEHFVIGRKMRGTRKGQISKSALTAPLYFLQNPLMLLQFGMI